jgi:hypothetical protein
MAKHFKDVCTCGICLKYFENPMYLKKLFTKRKDWWSCSRYRPEFKPQYHKKKKKHYV